MRSENGQSGRWSHPGNETALDIVAVPELTRIDLEAEPGSEQYHFLAKAQMNTIQIRRQWMQDMLMMLLRGKDDPWDVRQSNAQALAS